MVEKAHAAAAGGYHHGISSNLNRFRCCRAAGVADPGVGGGHRAQGHRGSRFRDLLRAGVTRSVRARGLDPAFVLVPRGVEGVHRDRRVRTRLCDGLLGHRDESLVPAVVPAVAGRAQSRLRGSRQSDGGPDPDSARGADYIAAIAAFYRDNDKLDHQSRAVAYEKAMEQVYERYPDDREAAVFYALALNASALKTDKTFGNQRRAAEILNKIWKDEPNYPGVVHYLIHSDDSPQFAAAGLDAAICYSKVAPDVPHALHMPSHIFTRLGMWQQSIDSNRAAHAAALDYVHKTHGPGSYDQETLHTMDYLEYAYLQIAQDGPAKEVVDELIGFRQSEGANLAGGYAVAAIPVRYALERRDWPTAATLSDPGIGFPLERFPWAEAMIAYARALGDARTRNIAGAEAEIGRLQSLGEKLKGNDTYWANQVEVQRLAAAGILAHVRGDDEKAVALVRAAADLDATMDKHPATPSSVLPARELLADLLLELNQPAAALVEYRAMLSTDPNRFRSLLGEARAAKQTGDPATAHDSYGKLMALSKPVGAARPELAEAKSYLTN